MNATLHPLVKWIVSALVPAFAAGSGLLMGGVHADKFAFWWAVGGAFVGGLLGKGTTVAGDKMVSRKGEGEG